MNTDHAPRMIIQIRGRGNSTPDNTVKMMLQNDPDVEPLLRNGRLGVGFTTARSGRRVCILEADMGDLLASTCAIRGAMIPGTLTQLV